MTSYLRRSAAAEYLQSKCGLFSSGTLAKLACIGGGPPFRKLGRFPVYVRDDLDAWIAGRLSRQMNNTIGNTKEAA